MIRIMDESILSDYESIHKELGDEVWNALDTYITQSNGELYLSDVLYSETEWKRFERWYNENSKK